MEDSSRVTLTVPRLVEMEVPALLVMVPLIFPVNLVESERLSVKVESLPTRISPVRV